jgi:hypothetical protein
MTPTRLLFHVALLALLAACALPVREMPADHIAAGIFGSDETSWKLRDAAAVSGSEGLVLIFTRLYFDRQKWVNDARFTDDDLALFHDNQYDYAPELDIKLDADGRYVAHRMMYGRYGAVWSVDPSFAHSIALSVNNGRRIAGTLRFEGRPTFAKIDFDLPVLAIGPMPRPGIPLPADGGEPGHYLMARSKATHDGDLGRLLSLLSPAERSDAIGHVTYDSDTLVGYESGDLDRSGTSLFMLKQRMDIPRIARITGGSVDGAIAWIDYEGSEGVMSDDPVTGTGVMRQDRSGRWWIEELTTKPEATSDDID